MHDNSPPETLLTGKPRNTLSELKSTKDKNVGELVRSFAHMEKALARLIQNEENSCENLLETLFSSVTDFSQGCEMHDDITAICLHVKGNPPISNKTEK